MIHLILLSISFNGELEWNGITKYVLIVNVWELPIAYIAYGLEIIYYDDQKHTFWKPALKYNNVYIKTDKIECL